MMSVVHERDAAGPTVTFHCTEWVIIAECLYGFDRLVAQRLAFVRWLRETGRLRDD
jgi:hypothetical protein